MDQVEGEMHMAIICQMAILLKIKPEKLAEAICGDKKEIIIYLGELALACAKMASNKEVGKFEDLLKKVKKGK